MNKSIYLLRANVALTSNVKLVVSSEYKLYLESYSSNRELADEKYKRFKIDVNSFLSERIARFYKNLPIELAFDVNNDISPDTIQDNFANQYDSIYWSGARYIEDRRYQEEFQYNTTLKIYPNNLPKNFIIFRKDKTGADVDFSNDPNFFKELKLIKSFDLTNKKSVGKLFEKNYITDDELPRSPIELNFKPFEFSKWNGYNYYTGGNISKSFFLQEYIQDQNTYYDFEKFLTNGFKDNGVIASNYLNVSYLYNDTVADTFIKDQKYYLEDVHELITLTRQQIITPEQYTIGSDTNGVYYIFNEDTPYRRNWTINQYTGFYINDKEKIDQISTYKNAKFKENEGIEIVNNVFLKNGENINPIDGTYKDYLPIYLKINNKFYLVEKNSNEQFVIVSDEIINGLLDDLLNTAQPTIKIEYTTGNSGYQNYIKNINDSFYYNNKFDLYENGIIIIKIFDDYYSLYIDSINKEVYINTDVYINANENRLYRKLGNDDAVVNNLKIENKDNNIIYFELFVLEFTDVKDFDLDRTDTEYTKQEYEKNNEINYFRPTIYPLDINSETVPKKLYYEKNYNIYVDDNGTLTQINTFDKFLLGLASEYAASGDLYMLNNLDNLTDIWNVNQYVNKWGLNSSINNNSYAYKINNNLTISGKNNFTSSTYGKKPDIGNLNLDYFYNIGQPVDFDIGSVNNLINYQNNLFENIMFRTLNIDIPNITGGVLISDLLKFDIDYYKNINTKSDYFHYIFNNPTKINGSIQLNNRISYVQQPDQTNGPEVYLRGFNAYINYLQQKNPNNVGNAKKIPARDLEGYGFSIVFTPRYIRNDETDRIGNAGIECIINKKFKNILINIYLCVPTNSYTTIDYSLRDRIYTDSFVHYTEYNTLTGQYSWKRSTLSHEALTLNNFIDTLESDTLESDEYLDGVSYTIVEDIKLFTVEDFSIYQSNNNLLKIKLTEDIKIKHGDWVKINNTGINDFDVNLQIVEILNNKTFVVKVNTDQSGNISSLNNNLSIIKLTTGISIKPFEFEIKKPDDIKIDTNRLEIVGNTSSPIKPINTANMFDNIVIDIDNDSLIEHVYINDAINRKKIKRSYNELNDSEIRNLPTILRYSGDYEPILKNIELFNTNKTIIYNTSDINITHLSSNEIDDAFYLSIHMDNSNGSLNDISVGDMVYINIDVSESNTHQILKKIEYTTHNVIEIKESYLSDIEFVLSTKYDQVPVSSDIDINADYGFFLSGYIYKVIKPNKLFEFNYKDFSINKNIIIAKTYTTINPMRSTKTINDSANKYALIDEHGSTHINKNIFKSPWDLTYYYETLPNKYNEI